MTITARAANLFAAAALLAAANAVHAQDWNHDPSSAIGPARWGTQAFRFSTCGAGDPVFAEVGRKQTPVDIVTADTVASGLPALSFHYRNTPLKAENNGHVIEVPYAPGSEIRVGRETYELLQFHFHAPSEHTIDGRHAAAEVHLVHRNQLLDLAVVGVLVEIGYPVNATIDFILRHAPREEGEVDLHGKASARELLPKGRGYYNYSGSLTTPPCSEGVRWFVLKQPVYVSREAIDHLHEIIGEFPHYAGFPDNNRPLMPLNGRAILNGKAD